MKFGYLNLLSEKRKSKKKKKKKIEKKKLIKKNYIKVSKDKFHFSNI